MMCEACNSTMTTRSWSDHKFEPLILCPHPIAFTHGKISKNVGEMSGSVREYAKFMPTLWLKLYVTIKGHEFDPLNYFLYAFVITLSHKPIRESPPQFENRIMARVYVRGSSNKE